MPYITQDERKQIALGKPPSTPGQLNYVITRLVIESSIGTLKAHIIEEILLYSNGKPQSYTLFNEIMGVLECVIKEYRRRVCFDVYIDSVFEVLKEEFYSQYVGPYEDKKIEQNGDVFG
jgi:hypothetical protein